MDSDTEESLMAAYIAGDRRAFERLFRKVGPKLHAFFMRSFRDESVADELLQTTFLRVHRARGSYRPELPLRPWLFTIAARIRRDEWRRRYRLPESGGEEALFAADQAAALSLAREREAAKDRFSEVLAAMNELPEMHRTILELHRYQGMTYGEISEILGSTPGAVRQHAFRAYESLRQRLKATLGDEAGDVRQA
jgi:RNA polymerase sigma-70 factor (ECF subfamily)